MLAFPRKRPRSPSPTHDTSPLDVFLKRRRQANIHVNSEDAFELNPLQPYAQVDGNAEEEYGREDQYARFVERRRTKQWERQNAPQSSSQAQEHSTPDTAQRHASSNPAVRGASQSPLPRVYSQPENRFQMSSSPVRHHPPSSSPFRPSQSSLSNGPTGSSSSDATRFDDEWGIDEMRREWGDEYVNQNSLLHQLHLARATQRQRLGRQVSSIQAQSSPYPVQTPEETPSYLLQTPSSVHIPSAPYDYTTHRGHRGNPSSDIQYHMASSPYSHLHNTPYSHLNNTPESSAEYTPAPQRYAGGMEFDTPAGKPENGDAMEEEIRIRYEETNRLLAELEVVRRNRWGEQ